MALAAAWLFPLGQSQNTSARAAWLFPLGQSQNTSARAACVSTVLAKSGTRAHSISAASTASARFISVIDVAPRRGVKHSAILALDPDFYKIPYVEGVPVGKRLKLWNLPPNCDRNELMDWFVSIPEINCETIEFTDDPELNAQGVNGFVEFATKQDACMAIVRLDGRKFKGRCIRMDFVEKRPHEREVGGRRNRPNRRSYSSDYSSPVQDFQPRGATATAESGAPRPSSAFSFPLTSHRIYVGNLSFNVDENGLQDLFSKHGTVVETRVMRDRETGTSRGFGFVSMSTADEMHGAISALHGKPLDGRALKVSVASR